jgi:hypothetical protein
LNSFKPLKEPNCISFSKIRICLRDM